MENKEILDNIINKVCSENKVQLYEWKLKGNLKNQTLVVFITKNNGCTLADCQMVSEKLSDELDMQDIFDFRYTLEVSSPGLSRKLKKLNHFVGAVGEIVSIQYLNSERKLKNIKGKLNSADENFISVRIKDENVKIYYQQIRDAKTIFKWSSKSSNKKEKK